MIGRLKKGDRVRVRLARTKDEWCEAIVELASDTDPSSVALLLRNLVRMRDGGLIGCMLPITVDYKSQRVISLLGDEYELEVHPLSA